MIYSRNTLNNNLFVAGLLALMLSSLYFASGDSTYRDCNFSQHLNSGSIYYVYNSDYPDASRGRQYCRWMADSDYRVKLTCNIFNMPRNIGCSFDRLTVYVNASMGLSYCGNETFGIESTGKVMTIELSTSFWSPGVKFLCELQAIEETDQDDDCRCGHKNPTKIVGGVETGVNEYPMMTGLVDFFKRFLYCGGSIISQRHVLTAAHCVIGRNASDVGVLVGDHDITTGMETNASRIYTVHGFHVHPLYNNAPMQNDIAVVTVNSVISFSEAVGPACLPFQHQFDSFAGNHVDLLGWGTTEFGGMKSNTLQKVNVSVITNRDCRRTYQNLSYGQLCTSGKNKDACQFDSGGPALWQDPTTKREVLIGIISFGIACAEEEPGVNTRVGTYIDWILSVTPGTAYCKAE